MWYMTIYYIQIKFEKAGYVSILAGVMASDRPKNGKKIQFPLNNSSLNEWISSQFVWYVTIIKILAEFTKGNCFLL